VPDARALLHSRRTWLAIIGIAIGLAIRLVLISKRGTNDVDYYIAWGYDTVNLGLERAYHGIYFPLQYDVFALAVRGANALGISSVTALKLTTLGFDLGSLGLLAVLLNRCGAPRMYALLYWLHPFFLTIFSLGYIDAHMGFFVLLALVGISYSRVWWHYVLAGIPLGVACLLKPQAELLVFAVGGIAVVSVAGGRLGLLPELRAVGRRYVLLLAGPVVLFGLFSVLLASGDHGLGHLAYTYSPGELARQSNGLSANMPNPWYVVAYVRHAGDQPIYAVTGPSVLHTLSFLVTAPLLLASMLLLMRRRGLTAIQATVAILAVAALVTPMTLTRAHENHLFLGGMLAIVLIPLVRRRWFSTAVNGLLLVQFVNLFGRYGFGLNSWSQGDFMKSVIRAYSGWPMVAAALVASGLFLVCLTELARWSRPRAARPS
jgi:hypothetical protein